MRLTGLLTRIRPEARIIALAEVIARECRHTVWQRVSNRISRMSLPSARGYARARAAAVVRREVDRVAAERNRSNSAWRQKLAHHTTDAVIRLVVAQAQATQTAVTPLRRAA